MSFGVKLALKQLDKVKAQRDDLEANLVLAKEALEKLGDKLNTISNRANTYGPGFPQTFADALWTLNQEAREALEKLK